MRTIVHSFKIVFLLFVLVWIFCSFNSNSPKPNIIIILTNDQGYGDIGRHGQPFLETPNMDRLYDESVRLDNFYINPSCLPTRGSLLTGMHEFRNGVTHTIVPRENLNKDVIITQKSKGIEIALHIEIRDEIDSIF